MRNTPHAVQVAIPAQVSFLLMAAPYTSASDSSFKPTPIPRISKSVSSDKKAIRSLDKMDKVYLDYINLIFILAVKVSGAVNIRETFSSTTCGREES